MLPFFSFFFSFLPPDVKVRTRAGETKRNSPVWERLTHSRCLSVSLPQPLDFEKKRQYNLRVQVENVHVNPRFFSAGPFRDEASIKIIVEDVDEPPVFERASYVMEVKENAARNTIVGSVSASDPDDKSSLIRCGSASAPNSTVSQKTRKRKQLSSFSFLLGKKSFISVHYAPEKKIIIFSFVVIKFKSKQQFMPPGVSIKKRWKNNFDDVVKSAGLRFEKCSPDFISYNKLFIEVIESEIMIRNNNLGSR